MNQEGNDLIDCTKCKSKVLAKVWDIHRIICDKNQRKKGQKLKRGQSSSGGRKKLEESALQGTIPCVQCGEQVAFEFYQIHEKECVGHQLQKCQRCKILFPTFLMDEHRQVCQGQQIHIKQPQPYQFPQESYSQGDIDSDEYSGPDEFEGEDVNIDLNMLISNLALEGEKIKEQGLNKAQLKLVKSGKIKKEEDCAICCTLMKKFHLLAELNCKHIYHRKCVEPWLEHNPLCPMCRRHALKK